MFGFIGAGDARDSTPKKVKASPKVAVGKS